MAGIQKQQKCERKLAIYNRDARITLSRLYPRREYFAAFLHQRSIFTVGKPKEVESAIFLVLYISGQKGYEEMEAVRGGGEKTGVMPVVVISEEKAKTHKTWYMTLYVFE